VTNRVAVVAKLDGLRCGDPLLEARLAVNELQTGFSEDFAIDKDITLEG
jgi:hypothetical protein